MKGGRRILTFKSCFFLLQVNAQRLLTDHDGTVWLRIEDAGYLDKEGRVWLVGRVKWRVERRNQIFWSTVVEQKVRLYVVSQE